MTSDYKPPASARSGRAATAAIWSFYAVSARTATGLAWYWQSRRRDGSASRSIAFDYYYDCITDARKHGYRGALPRGPSAPLKRLPELTPREAALRMVVNAVAPLRAAHEPA